MKQRAKSLKKKIPKKNQHTTESPKKLNIHAKGEIPTEKSKMQNETANSSNNSLNEAKGEIPKEKNKKGEILSQN
jgi:hypothetical protein